MPPEIIPLDPNLTWPREGGSYVRQPDGSLEPDPSTPPPAPAPPPPAPAPAPV